MEQFLDCSISKSLCGFQRYCIKEEDVINTEGSETCVVKTRRKREKKNIDCLTKEAEKIVDAVEEPVVKQIGVVTLVTKSYVVYELNGNSICLRGKYDYSIGDKIEV